jgi:hypothetical protein
VHEGVWPAILGKLSRVRQSGGSTGLPAARKRPAGDPSHGPLWWLVQLLSSNDMAAGVNSPCRPAWRLFAVDHPPQVSSSSAQNVRAIVSYAGSVPIKRLGDI